MIHIRKATENDLEAVSQIYENILAAQDKGEMFVGWIRGVYPTRQTAEAALARDDLFVEEDEGRIVGAAIINRVQVDVYAEVGWQHPAADDEVTVLHTLVIDPYVKGNGYGKAFVKFYEEYAAETGSPCLRMDTNAKNVNARRFYAKLGYTEVGIVPCVFNGIPGVNLVMLEKLAGSEN